MEIMIVVGNRCIHLPAQVEKAEFVVEVAAFFVGGGFVGGVFWHKGTPFLSVLQVDCCGKLYQM